MPLAMSAWRVQEGIALAVWEKPDEVLLRMMGVGSPPQGEAFEMWCAPDGKLKPRACEV